MSDRKEAASDVRALAYGGLLAARPGVFRFPTPQTVALAAGGGGNGGSGAAAPAPRAAKKKKKKKKQQKQKPAAAAPEKKKKKRKKKKKKGGGAGGGGRAAAPRPSFATPDSWEDWEHAPSDSRCWRVKQPADGRRRM